MKTSHIVTLFALSAAVLTMTGCAAEADDQNEQSEPAEATDVRAAVDTDHVTPSYTARVTIKDIKAGFGSCVGTTCTINGRTWDCKGGGYCALVL